MTSSGDWASWRSMTVGRRALLVQRRGHHRGSRSSAVIGAGRGGSLVRSMSKRAALEALADAVREAVRAAIGRDLTDILSRSDSCARHSAEWHD